MSIILSSATATNPRPASGARSRASFAPVLVVGASKKLSNHQFSPLLLVAPACLPPCTAHRRFAALSTHWKGRWASLIDVCESLRSRQSSRPPCRSLSADGRV